MKGNNIELWPMQKFHTFLMFVGAQCGKAEEAMNFYISLFPDSAIKEVHRNEKNEKFIDHAVFVLQGQEFMISDSPAEHQFTMTPALSVAVQCADEAELDRVYAELVAGGKALMPLDRYPFSQKFGWVEDRYGVSWQLNLPHARAA